jgi:HEAT repeat protein
LRAVAARIEPLLTEALADSDPDVRLLICEVVRELPSPVANRLMIELLDRETEINVCGAAMEVLAEVGDASALPALDRCARRFADEPFLASRSRRRPAYQRVS